MTQEEKKIRAAKLMAEAKKLRLKRDARIWDELKLVEIDGYVNVPPIPIPITQYHIDRLINAGAIPINNLIDQQWYFGNNRCCTVARWDANKKTFFYYKNSFGHDALDTAMHFELADNFALFVPLRVATEIEKEKELNKKR